MSEAKKPQPAKLLIGIITADLSIIEPVLKILNKRFGRIDYESPVFDFNFTDYYQKEMGDNLKRKFFSFSKLIDPALLVKIKVLTNRIEAGYCKGGRRLLNIDPGYITASKLALATAKDYNHRIYLGSGIFAELTLDFKDGTFRPWQWTYPDYRSQGYIDAFNHIRELYIKQLNKDRVKE